jgi:hypothetical protein
MRRTDHGTWREVGKEGGEAVHEAAVQLAREPAGLLDRRRAVAVAVAAARFHDHSFCCTRRGCVSVPSRGARAEWLRLCLYTGPPQCPSLHAAAQATTTTRCTT